MTIATNKYVWGVTIACVVGYLMLLLPVLPELSRWPFDIPPLDQARSMVTSWWTSQLSTVMELSSSTSNNPNSQQQQQEEAAASATESAAAVVPEKRKRTLLEQKFAMQGPILGWDASTITLDYQLAEWVTNDVLDYAWYDWDCQHKLDTLEPPGWNVVVPENLGLASVESEDNNAEEGIAQSSTSGDDDNDDDDDSPAEDAEMKMNHWRLAIQRQQQLGHDDNDDESDKDSSTMSTSFCIRFMLFNMPKHRQHAIEVTFRQSQLAIDIQEGQIQRVELSTPEPVRIKVQVNGRGRANVHRDDNDNGANDKEANPQQQEQSVDTDDTISNNGGDEDTDGEEREEEEKGDTEASSGSLSPSSTTTTTTVNEEL